MLCPCYLVVLISLRPCQAALHLQSRTISAAAGRFEADIGAHGRQVAGRFPSDGRGCDSDEVTSADRLLVAWMIGRVTAHCAGPLRAELAVAWYLSTRYKNSYLTAYLSTVAVTNQLQVCDILPILSL